MHNMSAFELLRLNVPQIRNDISVSWSDQPPSNLSCLDLGFIPPDPVVRITLQEEIDYLPTYVPILSIAIETKREINGKIELRVDTSMAILDGCPQYTP
jgi:hypothetical protein